MELFEPYRFGQLMLRNRFIRSATWDHSADTDGKVTEASLAIYSGLSKGNIGLIISGFAFVSSSGQAVDGQYGVHDDRMLSGLRKLARTAHGDGSKIALQIVHAGISAWGHIETAMAVSEVVHVNRLHREMTEENIESIIKDFAVAAMRAKEAGFDAVQLHGAHGYLMSQFLSPVLNRRTDRWGGSLENRSRFHLEVIRRIRQEIGKDFPLLIKFGIQDDLAHGLTLEEGVRVAGWMVNEGIDSIEVSAGVGGVAIPHLKPGETERVVFRARSAALKKAINISVMLVGGIRSLDMCEEIINSGDADMISMCRPFICEPDLLKRWQSGDRKPAKCISCSLCIKCAREGQLLECRTIHPLNR